MPFTVSHIASVLPLHKPLRRLGLLSAAVIGTMTPDLDLILPIRLPRSQTHGYWALLTFCLPAGLIAWALFQALIKPALVEVLPDRAYARLSAEHFHPRLGSVKIWVSAAFAVLFGALTHIVWDGLTHESGPGLRLLPISGGGPELGDSPWRMHHWLQHGSSVLGMAAVLTALWLWISHAQRAKLPPKRPLSADERRRWIATYVLVSLFPVGAAIAQIHGSRLLSAASLTLIAITAMRSAALALVFTSALIRRRLLILGVDQTNETGANLRAGGTQ